MIRTVLLTTGLFVAVVSPAVAQSWYGRPLTVTGQPGTPVDALPTPFSHGGSCVKLCDRDYMPCDPDYWKTADRRCNFNQRG